MTATVFEDVLRAKVEEKIGENYRVGIRKVPKNNGVTKTALEVSENGNKVGTLVYIDDMYDEGLNEEQITNLAADVEKICQKQTFAPVMDIIGSVTNWQEAKDNLVIRVINAEWNEKMLETMPHRTFLDLAIIYCVNLKNGTDNIASAVKREMMEYWQVSEEDLYEAAVNNMKRYYPESCKPLGEMFGLSDDSLCPLQVWRNSAGMYGASVIAYSSKVEELAETVGDDMYILPSSVHELLILPREGNDARELVEMVRSVNRIEVERDEWLSENVYCYSRSDKIYILIK